ncbi:hypothetical protein [Natronomonas marina]|uniref:hypothetical protein n=1 Tax=Natronomonas marina TaxID=2961939 RepID=UPI0020C98EAA|nr:hypothetical protein [Natronomonas marina]
MTADRHHDSASTVDVDSIVPARAIQQAADDHDVTPDALRVALRRDLERNLEMSDEITGQRPIVHETDDYLVAHVSDAVTTETPLPVLDVYEQMDDSDTDYLAGYPLVVPTPDEHTDDYEGFTNAAEQGDNDEHPLMEDGRDLSGSSSRDPPRYRTTISCDGCGRHIGTDGQYCRDCSPPSIGDTPEEGGLGADLRPADDAADEAGDDDE